MPSKTKFKQSTLVHSMHLIFKMQGVPKLICSSFLISSCISVVYAQEQILGAPENQATEQNEQVAAVAVAAAAPIPPAINASDLGVLPGQDSLTALKEQEQSSNQINELKPIQLDDNLENLPVIPVDQGMANEIFRVAEDAKNEAQAYRDQTAKNPAPVIGDVSQTELTEIKQAPLNMIS